MPLPLLGGLALTASALTGAYTLAETLGESALKAVSPEYKARKDYDELAEKYGNPKSDDIMQAMKDSGISVKNTYAAIRDYTDMEKNKKASERFNEYDTILDSWGDSLSNGKKSYRNRFDPDSWNRIKQVVFLSNDKDYEEIKKTGMSSNDIDVLMSNTEFENIKKETNINFKDKADAVRYAARNHMRQAEKEITERKLTSMFGGMEELQGKEYDSGNSKWNWINPVSWGGDRGYVKLNDEDSSPRPYIDKTLEDKSNRKRAMMLAFAQSLSEKQIENLKSQGTQGLGAISDFIRNVNDSSDLRENLINFSDQYGALGSIIGPSLAAQIIDNYEKNLEYYNKERNIHNLPEKDRLHITHIPTDKNGIPGKKEKTLFSGIYMPDSMFDRDVKSINEYYKQKKNSEAIQEAIDRVLKKKKD